MIIHWHRSDNNYPHSIDEVTKMEKTDLSLWNGVRCWQFCPRVPTACTPGPTPSSEALTVPHRCEPSAPAHLVNAGSETLRWVLTNYPKLYSRQVVKPELKSPSGLWPVPSPNLALALFSTYIIFRDCFLFFFSQVNMLTFTRLWILSTSLCDLVTLRTIKEKKRKFSKYKFCDYRVKKKILTQHFCVCTCT